MTGTHELLLASGCPVSYPSLRRIIVKRNWREGSKTMVPMADTPPGEVAEAGFGRPGMISENRLVRTPPYRKSAVTEQAVCSLVPQRGPVLSFPPNTTPAGQLVQRASPPVDVSGRSGPSLRDLPHRRRMGSPAPGIPGTAQVRWRPIHRTTLQSPGEPLTRHASDARCRPGVAEKGF